MIKSRKVSWLSVLVLLVTAGLVAGPSATERVLVSPRLSTVEVGDTVALAIAIDSSISSVHFYRVKMQFDTTVLKFVSADPSAVWDSIGFANAGSDFHYKDSTDPITGEWYIDVFSAFYTQPPVINGYNDLCTIAFTAQQSGVSPVTFYYYRLENNVGFGESIPCSADDGIVYVCPLPSGHEPGNVDGITSSGNPINVSDLSYLVNYLFKGGQPPQPVQLNGDVDCSLRINVADLTYLVDYLFRAGPAPCNPCQ